MFHRAKPNEANEKNEGNSQSEAKVSGTQTQTQAKSSNQQPKTETATMAQDSKKDDSTNEQAQATSNNPFQRQNQPSRPAPFQGNGAAPQAGFTNTSENDDNRHLVIGQGITMSGQIEACDHLTIEGRVEATLKGARVLDIAESGTFVGKVKIEEASVAGNFEGDLTVNGRLTVRSSGSINGNISYGELEIEAGATVQGTITPKNAAKSETAEKKSVKPAKSDKQPAAKTENTSNNNELPFADKAAAAS